VAYQANCDGSYDIWVADLVTGAATAVMSTADVDEREPDWSPDSSRLVYRATPRDVGRNEDGDLFSIHIDGSGSASLGARGRSPTWSPDGSRVALMSERDGSWEIYVIDVGSRDALRVTSCDANCRWPSWSPDGDAVIYHTTTGVGSVTADAIWVTSLSGGSATQLIAGQHAGRPSWSAEGLVVFNSDSGIEVVTAEGVNRRTLIAGDVNWAPVWSR
jgi:TolB protein